mmetsp:Transcript_103198/g.287226  ORF Transcript_103198/g.287226 Transcript_103198/m.287226 type:complete len:368 (-) Transcript_103198:350-1453(-)
MNSLATSSAGCDPHMALAAAGDAAPDGAVAAASPEERWGLGDEAAAVAAAAVACTPPARRPMAPSRWATCEEICMQRSASPARSASHAREKSPTTLRISFRVSPSSRASLWTWLPTAPSQARSAAVSERVAWTPCASCARAAHSSPSCHDKRSRSLPEHSCEEAVSPPRPPPALLTTESLPLLLALSGAGGQPGGRCCSPHGGPAALAAVDCSDFVSARSSASRETLISRALTLWDNTDSCALSLRIWSSAPERTSPRRKHFSSEVSEPAAPAPLPPPATASGEAAARWPPAACSVCRVVKRCSQCAIRPSILLACSACCCSSARCHTTSAANASSEYEPDGADGPPGSALSPPGCLGCNSCDARLA